MQSTIINGCALEWQRWPAPEQSQTQLPPLVLLHEGLGSVQTWRGFPAWLAAQTGCDVIVYSRPGYGHSGPMPLPRTKQYLHVEATEVLPAFVQSLDLPRPPVLFGHSDGGSIVLLAAALADMPLAGVVTMAPHVLVEEATMAGIRRAGERWKQGDEFRLRLGRYHADVDTVFHTWHDTWLADWFRDWNIVQDLAKITVPVLAIQGEDDEYATMQQMDLIEAHCGADVKVVKLPHCGHWPQREQPDALLAAVGEFVARL
ncbi:MAG: alpha/beta hydrolase [Rhodocyclaceae bacterium]|nr:alpha/beta hydrolase [Rhodocyclaceae bacterium]